MSSPDVPAVHGETTARARCSLDELFADLMTGPTGLSAIDATRRLDELGPNELPSARKPSILEKVSVQVRNLFNVLLLFASALSFLVGFAYGDSGSVQMGLAILAVVLFNIAFSILQERRAEKVVEALRKLIPANAKVLRGGSVAQVSVLGLVPGDVFSLEEGDHVPADARLLASFNVSVDQSILTGESALQERSADARPGPEVTNAAECANLLLAGTTIASGSGTAVVIATGAKTVFGRIVTTTREIKEAPSPLQRQLGTTARLNFVAAVAVGLAFLVIALVVRNLSAFNALLIMIAVAIDLVPEGLQITVTLALAIASVSMSRRNVVVKRLASVETLGSSTVICTDKTGTITAGQMTVRKVWTVGRTFDVTGQGYEPEGQVLLDGKPVHLGDREDLRWLCEIAAFDNTATLTPPLDRRRQRWTAIGDTTDAALLAFSLKGGIEGKKALLQNPRVALIPFDSSRKMMTSVHRYRDGRIVAYAKGAAQSILERTRQVLQDGREEPLTPDVRKAIMDQVDRFAAEAFRVLALAYRILPSELETYRSETVEDELTFVGLVAIYDPPRPNVADAVLKARGAGVRIVMITGDHELTAEAIARRVGIITTQEHGVVTGPRLAQMPDDELSALLDTEELVFARITPEQKHQIVKAFQAKGEIVAVTGDGVNDAPALAEADVGIAMGITGTDVARESADMVLLDDSFASIVGGIELGRGVFDNLRKFIIYVFSHNWAELISFVAFVLLNAPIAIGVVQVLSIDLVMDIPPSLALTVEPPEPKVMTQPPRGPKSRLFDLGALLTSAYVGVPVGIAAVLAGFAVWTQGGWSLGQPSVPDPAAYARGVAVVIAGIMMGQVGNLFVQRSRRESVFGLRLTRNRWLLPALASTLAILVAYIYVPFFQSILQTAPLPIGAWAFIVLLVPMVVTLEEARKFVARRVFPAPAMPVPTILPAPAPGVGLLPAAGPTPLGRARAPAVGPAFLERGPPILVPLFSQPAEDRLLPIAMSLAEYSGSRLVFARMLGREADQVAWEESQGRAQAMAAEAEIPCAFVDVRAAAARSGPRGVGQILRNVARQNGAETVVVSVDRRTFSTRRAAQSLAWLRDFEDRKAILVVGAAAEPTVVPQAFRVLIPVLEEFRPEPFDVAAALTASARFPAVDVVAAKVIRLPPIVPVYSTYRPESLFDEERELAFLKGLRMRPLERLLSPKLLIVRDIGRDLADFAAERNVDVILMAGDRGAARHGYLGREEREIAKRARCAVVIALAAEPEAS